MPIVDLRFVLRQTCGSPYLWIWWLELPFPLVRGVSSPRTPAVVDQRGSAAELLLGLVLWVSGFWIKLVKFGSVAQRHQQMPVTERFKQGRFRNRFREKRH